MCAMSFANPSALMATENASIFTPNHRFRLKKTATTMSLLDADKVHPMQLRRLHGHSECI